jgi:hypothetical protein
VHGRVLGVGVALIGLVVVGVVVVYPGLTGLATAGAALGALAGAAVFAIRSGEPRTRIAIVAVGITSALITVAAFSMFSNGLRFYGGYSASPTVTRAVPYVGRFRYDDERRMLQGREVVRVTRTDLIRVAERPYPGAWIVTPAVRRRALGDDWGLVGIPKENVYAYARERAIEVREPQLYRRPLREHRLAIDSITSEYLRAELVPRDGSTLELRVPSGLVYETNPEGKWREFGDDDVVTVRLTGLEDDPGRAGVDLQVANAVGRSSLYAALDDATAWGFVKWVVGLFAGVVGAFFVQRYLNRRFPAPEQA